MVFKSKERGSSPLSLLLNTERFLRQSRRFFTKFKEPHNFTHHQKWEIMLLFVFFLTGTKEKSATYKKNVITQVTEKRKKSFVLKKLIK